MIIIYGLILSGMLPGMHTVSNIKPLFVGKGIVVMLSYAYSGICGIFNWLKPSVFDKYIPEIWRMDMQNNSSLKELPVPNNHL